MWIIGAAIKIVVTGLIFGFILKIAARIIIKEGIDFSDAFKTAIVANAGIVLCDLGLQQLALDGTLNTTLGLLLILVIWTLAMIVVIGITVAQAVLVALVFTLLTSLIKFVFELMLATGAAVGSPGS